MKVFFKKIFFQMSCVMFSPRKHAVDSGPPVFTVSIYACQDGALHLARSNIPDSRGKAGLQHRHSTVCVHS